MKLTVNKLESRGYPPRLHDRSLSHFDMMTDCVRQIAGRTDRRNLLLLLHTLVQRSAEHRCVIIIV